MEITELLARIATCRECGDGAGVTNAQNELLERVLPLLRGPAEKKMAGEHGYQTLQPKALINEAVMKVLGQSQFHVTCTVELVSLLRRRMDDVLVDHARRRDTLRRGAEAPGRRPERVELGNEAELPDFLRNSERQDDLVYLNELFDALESRSASAAQVFWRHHFLGETFEQVAAKRNISVRTAKTRDAQAKTILIDILRGQSA